MGRPRRNSNKSDSGSTAGNVYNASLAAAQQQKGHVSDSLVSAGTNSNTNTSGLTPNLDVMNLAIASEKIESEKNEIVSIASSSENGSTSPTDSIPVPSIPKFIPIAPTFNPITPAFISVPVTPKIDPKPTPTLATIDQITAATNINRRSLSIAELVSFISSNHQISSLSSASVPHSNSFNSALNSLNLPEALRSTLEKADSPILNALLPLIRQKLADKTALNRRNSASADLSSSLSSTSPTSSYHENNNNLSSRRSSTSSRSEDHRLSHKLAERKRRKEMKDVFDGLKNALPPGVPKSSKWEILNEASETIDDLLAQEQALLYQRNDLLKLINESSKQ